MDRRVRNATVAWGYIDKGKRFLKQWGVLCNQILKSRNTALALDPTHICANIVKIYDLMEVMASGERNTNISIHASYSLANGRNGSWQLNLGPYVHRCTTYFARKEQAGSICPLRGVVQPD